MWYINTMDYVLLSNKKERGLIYATTWMLSVQDGRNLALPVITQIFRLVAQDVAEWGLGGGEVWK